MSDNLLEKVISSAGIGGGNPVGGGLLQPEQANRFIDYMWDATVLGSQVRSIRLRSNEIEIDRIGVGKRLLRGAVEATDTGENAGVFFSKISLSTKKLRLDWELSSEALEDNLEGEALEDHIARLMATQAGNDLEDLAINGDTASADPLLSVFDGWKKMAHGAAGNTFATAKTDGAAHIVDNAGQPLNRAAANKALKAMPRVYMQKRNQLKFFTGSNLIQDYLYSIVEDAGQGAGQFYGDTNRTVRTEGPAGFSMGSLFGVPVQEVPYFDETVAGDYSGATGQHGELWLTFPQNLLWAIKREIKVYRTFQEKKDTIEYTMYCRVGTAVENTDAFVVVKNVKVQS
jgi:hypothetical protein